MTAEAYLKKAVAAGAELYVEAGRLRGRGPRPDPELFATLREHEAEIVALLASRLSVAPPTTTAVDRAVEYHQRRIAEKEASYAAQGLGPDGKTPLAEYQRLAAEGAKTAKAALAAGHESLSKITTTPAPTNGPWPEPKITKGSYFGADQVPSRYEPGWRALLAGCPSWAAPLQWEMAIFSLRDLFAEWGAELCRLNWRPEDIFDRWHGIAWFLRGQHVTAVGPRHAFLEDGRVFERTGR
jgi:hypothetical protein